MHLDFPTKGIAIISLIEAGFSHNQCAMVFGATTKQVGVLAAATRRRGQLPAPISQEAIKKLESIVGIRNGKKDGRSHRHLVSLDLGD